MTDSIDVKKTLAVGDKTYTFYSLNALAADAGLGRVQQLPFTLKILLENLLRHGHTVAWEDISALANWPVTRSVKKEIAYHPSRVLMQDFTGVPAVVDLATMRDAVHDLGGNPNKINPLCPVDLVIDHSVQVDKAGNTAAFEKNVNMEMLRNRERYAFLRWGQQAFDNFRVVPPGTGICHQVNLEYLANVVWGKDTADGECIAFPDTLVGTDSHTTMINGLGVLGWGVGGIEAEAAMLGQPISMLIPDVVGVELTGQLPEGTTATDLVLTITQMLREQGVVGKFVEFHGKGLTHLPLAERATIANMAPEYGATCGFFPVDQETLNYLTLTGRSQETCDLVKAYCQAQGLWYDPAASKAVYTETLQLDLSTIEPSLAGPKRPQDRVSLSHLDQAFQGLLGSLNKQNDAEKSVQVEGEAFDLHHGSVVIAAITSCTNTSNPSVLMSAGLLAQNAIKKGLMTQPWVKASLAPGSKVVMDYLGAANLLKPLEALGFYLVGFGCTTCIGNSGPLDAPIANTVIDNDLVVSSVLSGNRNFEGRVHPLVQANWLASPPLVVAFALAGTTRIDLANDPLGNDPDGNPVYLRDIWPNSKDIAAAVSHVDQAMFAKEYAVVFEGDATWKSLPTPSSDTYAWNDNSTYIKQPPFFEGMPKTPTAASNIKGARILALLGDSVTTDHISPAGAIKEDSPAGHYLTDHNVDLPHFNSYGSRRGNHDIMMRGTFANVRIRNEMAPGTEGGVTQYIPTGEIMPIYDAAMRYKTDGTPLVVIAGKEYGTGSSRDWAAKGTLLLGVKAVIAESYERIHRSNLIGMGVLPLEFTAGDSRKTLTLTGTETIDIHGLDRPIAPGASLSATIHYDDGHTKKIQLLSRIDTTDEVNYFVHGGILHYVLRDLAS